MKFSLTNLHQRCHKMKVRLWIHSNQSHSVLPGKYQLQVLRPLLTQTFTEVEMDQEYVKQHRLHANSYKGLFTSISAFENFKNCFLIPFLIVLNENYSLSPTIFSLMPFVQIFKSPDVILHYSHGLIFLQF